MKIEFYKVTWYSKLLAVVLFVSTFFVGFVIGERKINIYYLPIKLEMTQYKTYTDIALHMSVTYPENFIIDNTYKYQMLGPGKDIEGIKFAIPKSISDGTNLSNDSYISIENIKQSKNCTADLFLDQAKASSLIDGNMTYSYASSTGAAAGNRYEEKIYAIPGTNSCIAVRYFIHYGVLENYPEGTIKQFNEKALLDQFDQIRHTLTFN
ncbi:MAG: hypothetical protein WA057_04775 [Candidatus Magasanikiibacteriota bacterium]